jgi:hypothetical protein
MSPTRPWPDWLPPKVAEGADNLLESIGADRTTPPDPKALRAKYPVQGFKDYNQHVVKTFELIQRLTCDDRMRAVWRELLRRHQGEGGGYFHPAQRMPEHPTDLDDEVLQARALCHIFDVAVILVSAALPAMTPAELERDLAKSIEDENQLRRAARLVEADNNDPELAAALVKKADLYARGRELYAQLGFPKVNRHRNDPQTVGYVMAFVAAVEEVFGKKMVRTVATIASVALGREVSEKLVQGVANVTPGSIRP